VFQVAGASGPEAIAATNPPFFTARASRDVGRSPKVQPNSRP
jgi:hypothetical protein